MRSFLKRIPWTTVVLIWLAISFLVCPFFDHGLGYISLYVLIFKNGIRVFASFYLFFRYLIPNPRYPNDNINDAATVGFLFVVLFILGAISSFFLFQNLSDFFSGPIDDSVIITEFSNHLISPLYPLKSSSTYKTSFYSLKHNKTRYVYIGDKIAFPNQKKNLNELKSLYSRYYNTVSASMKYYPNSHLLISISNIEN